MEIWIAVLVLFIVAVSVMVGLHLNNHPKRRARREEVLALKASGAFPHRKSNG